MHFFKSSDTCFIKMVSKNTNLVTRITQRIANVGINFRKQNPEIHRLAVAASTCFTIAYILQTVALVNSKGDTDRLFECFGDMCFCGMGILKLMSLYRNHKHWSLLLNTVTKLEKEHINEEVSSAEYDSDEGDKATFSHYIFAYTEKFRTISRLLSRFYGCTAVIYILSPFAEYVLFKDNSVAGWPHILQVWAPLDVNIFGYLFTILIEVVAASYCVCIHVAFDLTTVGIMIFISGQFSLLRDYSENVAGKGRCWQLSKRRDERAHHRIKKCHKIHVLLMSSTNELNNLLKNILGVYFFMATLTLCSVAVQLNSELSSMQLVSSLQYMCASLTQLYLFCYYGDNVLHESSVDMGRGSFGAAYWCLSPRVRRELAVLGMGMMLPRRFYAGPFIRLDLPSFIQVVRTAYSYYAVIRK